MISLDLPRIYDSRITGGDLVAVLHCNTVLNCFPIWWKFPNWCAYDCAYRFDSSLNPFPFMTGLFRCHNAKYFFFSFSLRLLDLFWSTRNLELVLFQLESSLVILWKFITIIRSILMMKINSSTYELSNLDSTWLFQHWHENLSIAHFLELLSKFICVGEVYVWGCTHLFDASSSAEILIDLKFELGLWFPPSFYVNWAVRSLLAQLCSCLELVLI